ncbi:uncharacterized protein [Dermacentor albipictus]|uniref:uncharacterized protein isoform X2 n=1 Tax=Dermacentor albipictus TaxID=60249 RepID=UPI0038FCE9E3
MTNVVMRQSSSLDVVAKKIRHGTLSLDSLKYRALEKWSLSQVSSQVSIDIGNPAINSANSIYHANSGGLDPTRAHSPFTGNCSSITVTADEMDGSFQPGEIGENIFEGRLSVALVAQRAAAIFPLSLSHEWNTCEQTTPSRVALLSSTLFDSISPCEQTTLSDFLFCIFLVSRPPCLSFCFAFFL